MSLEVLAKLNALNKYIANRNVTKETDSCSPIGSILSPTDLQSASPSSTAYEKHGGCRVPHHTFYVPELSEHVNITRDYIRWVVEEPKVFETIFDQIRYAHDRDLEKKNLRRR